MKNALLLIFTSILFFSCKKNNNDFLAPTQSGQNVIAFTVNGQQHVYKGISTWNDPGGIRYSSEMLQDSSKCIDLLGDGVGSLFSGASAHDELEFIANIGKVASPSLNVPYKIGNNIYLASFYDTYDEHNILIASYSVNSATSYVIFNRFDSVVAGTFVFSGRNSSDSIELTNGFFDVALK